MAWIFMNDAFLSIVQEPSKRAHLLVRARVKGDIQRIWPNAKVQRTPHRDYAYRASILRQAVAAAIAERILGIDYGNFKNSVDEHERHRSYARVWGVMFELQSQMERPAREEFGWPGRGLFEGLDGDDLEPKPTRRKRTKADEPCQNGVKKTPRRRR